MKLKQKIRERTNGFCIYNPQNVEQNNKRQKSLGYQREDEDLGWIREAKETYLPDENLWWVNCINVITLKNPSNNIILKDNYLGWFYFSWLILFLYPK